MAKFRVASTPRYFDKAANEWKDGDSLFLTCTVWRQAAENVAESLVRGTRVIITGRLKQRSYETKEHEKRTVYELEVDEVGPSLRNASAKVQKVTRTSAGNGGQAATAAGGSGGQGARAARAARAAAAQAAARDYGPVGQRPELAAAEDTPTSLPSRSS